MATSRVQKSILNAKVNLFFYFISLVISFFSRKIFLDSLGDDFMGLAGTLYNILGFFNLAELGVAGAIGYMLYKPIFDQDHETINQIISVFGYIYRRIGQLILLMALIFSCFLPMIFEKSGMPMGIVFFAYFSFLASSLLGYFINFRQMLLGADQRNYVIQGYFQTMLFTKTLVQMFLCYYTGNYYLWVALELVFGIAFSLVLNWKIDKTYPWLKANITKGRFLFKDYPEIVTKTKQLFVHQIAGVVLLQATQPLIYAYGSLQLVALYGNYMLIISKTSSLFGAMTAGIGAGIGNLIAEGNKNNIKKVFWELMTFSYFIAFILIFSFFFLLPPFVSLWLGNSYILPFSVLGVILCNLFFQQVRGIIDNFIRGYGLFHDIWAPIVETFINIGCAIILGYYWGIQGVLLGTTISLFFITYCWKSYFLYSQGFKRKVSEYWLGIMKLLLLGFVSIVLLNLFIDKILSINPTKSYLSWVLYALVIVPLFALVYWTLLMIFTAGMRNFTIRMRNRFIK